MRTQFVGDSNSCIFHEILLAYGMTYLFTLNQLYVAPFLNNWAVFVAPCGMTEIL